MQNPALWLNSVLAEDQPKLLTAWQHVNGNQETRIEYRIRGTDGQIHHFQDSFVLLSTPDDAAEVVGERHYLPHIVAEEQPTALTVDTGPVSPLTIPFEQRLFDTLPIGLALTRMSGELVQINPAFASIIGRSVAETLELTYWDITPPLYAKQEAKQLRALNTTGHYGPYEKHYLHADGRWVPVRLSGQLIEHDGETYIWSSVENIVDLKTTEQELRRSEAELREIIDNLPDTFYRTDANGIIVLVSRMVTNLLGWSVEEAMGQQLADYYVDPHGRELFIAALHENGGSLSGYETEFWHKDGSKIWVATSSHFWYDNTGEIIGVEGAARDITALKRSQDMLRQAAAVFETAAEAALITDSDNHIVAVNPAFTEITGYSQEEVLGQTPMFLRSGQHADDFFEQQWRTIEKEGRWQGELWHRCKNGQIIPTWQTTSTVRNEDGEITHHVSLIADITPLKRTQEQLNHLAHHDSLTGLANRLVVEDRLAHAIQVARRSHASLAVLFMDLDRFKDINDSFGHPAGDKLLCEAARRLTETVREQDTVARLGGDEFIILLDTIDDPQDAAQLATKLIKAFAPPFEVAGHDLRLTLSVGISIFPRDGKDVSSLVKNADAAMYRAKEDGRNGFNFYTEKLTIAAFERLTLETGLRHALLNDEFELHYQPQIDLTDGSLLGAEALIRWNHPDMGLMYPDDFIPLAERIGLVVEIGEWVMNTACQQLRCWDENGQRLPRISMNISVAQIQQEGFAARVADCMRLVGVAPARLELEITEGVVMHKRKQAMRTLSQLRALDISIAIDDFGTGYSSLSQLKRLPINKLKIDKSFVRDIPNDRNDEAITLAVIALAHSLDLTVIAEGVETEQQRDFLRQHGCPAGQGNLYSPALPATDFARRWLPHSG